MQTLYSYKWNILYWLKIKYENIQIASETQGFSHLGYLVVSLYLTSLYQMFEIVYKALHNTVGCCALMSVYYQHHLSVLIQIQILNC